MRGPAQRGHGQGGEEGVAPSPVVEGARHDNGNSRENEACSKSEEEDGSPPRPVLRGCVLMVVDDERRRPQAADEDEGGAARGRAAAAVPDPGHPSSTANTR